MAEFTGVSRLLSRRQLLRTASLAPVAALLPAMLAGCDSMRAGPTGSAARRFFGAHEAAVVQAATARLVPGPADEPSEAEHPGAREADVVGYVDGLLAAFAVDPPRVHAGGPVSDRPAGGPDEMSAFVPLSRVQREAWRSRVQQLQRTYREGIRRLDRLAGGDFTALAPARQDHVLTSVEVQPFLDAMFTHAIEGMYSVPEYGGNAGLSGWRDIGWPGDRQPLGYPATQVTRSDGPDPVRPGGAVAELLRLLDPTWTGPGGG